MDFDQAKAIALELLHVRIGAALDRIAKGHAPMRIPADHLSDADLVISDCGSVIRALLQRVEEQAREIERIEADRRNLIYERDMEHEAHVAAEVKLRAEVERFEPALRLEGEPEGGDHA